MTSVSTDLGTLPPQEGLRLDETRLNAYLRSSVDGYRGPLEVRQFTGGQSNPTYLLTTPGARYVLRKKPPGELLASAHAVDREYRVMAALSEHTRVPVPRMRALCMDESVLGTPFYVMDFVAGRILRDPAFPDIPQAERRNYTFTLCDSLALLHQVVPEHVGLADFGKPTGYVARQIARWSKQYREDREAGRVESMEKLIDWLTAHQPASEDAATVLHGDYRVDNVIYHPSEPRVLAILDWELSSLGEARADLAYFLMRYRMPALALPGHRGVDVQALGLPSETQVVARYCAATGRDGISDLEYFIVFCVFRLAGIFHGIRGRVVRGNAVNPRAREYAQYVEAIADFGWALAREAS